MGERFIPLLEQDVNLEPFNFGAGQPLTWQDEYEEWLEEVHDKMEELSELAGYLGEN